MIKRATGHDHIKGGKAKGAGQTRRHGMEYHGPVTIEYALGISRRAGRVAKEGPRIFVKTGPSDRRALGRQQGLIAKGIDRAGLMTGLIGHLDEGLDRGQLRGNARDQIGEIAIEK